MTHLDPRSGKTLRREIEQINKFPDEMVPDHYVVRHITSSYKQPGTTEGTTDVIVREIKQWHKIPKEQLSEYMNAA